jgi:hypothetical protein
MYESASTIEAAAEHLLSLAEEAWGRSTLGQEKWLEPTLEQDPAGG